MVDSINKLRCSKAECEVAITGACAEGHAPPRSCPFFGQQAATEIEEYEEDEAEDVSEGVTEKQWISLPLGEPLSPEDIDLFLRRQPATFVSIIGQRDSGKTTLVNSIYERFLKGPFAGYLFAGSRTLVGLEKRSHYSRIESRRTHPDTPRTSISEGLRFFHLAVQDMESKARRFDLMLSDRAGEIYDQARNNTEIVSGLLEIKKADRLVLLLDGARVADPVHRAGSMESLRQTLRVFLDGGGLDKASRVQVVTTKIDLLTRLPQSEAVEKRVLQFCQLLEDNFAPRLGELSFWKIAARDPSGSFLPAHGVAELFREWLTPRPPVIQRSMLTGPIVTEFDKLLLRTPMDVIA